jgi:hypothetical protein
VSLAPRSRGHCIRSVSRSERLRNRKSVPLGTSTWARMSRSVACFRCRIRPPHFSRGLWVRQACVGAACRQGLLQVEPNQAARNGLTRGVHCHEVRYALGLTITLHPRTAVFQFFRGMVSQRAAGALRCITIQAFPFQSLRLAKSEGRPPRIGPRLRNSMTVRARPNERTSARCIT